MAFAASGSGDARLSDKTRYILSSADLTQHAIAIDASPNHILNSFQNQQLPPNHLVLPRYNGSRYQRPMPSRIRAFSFWRAGFSPRETSVSQLERNKYLMTTPTQAESNRANAQRSTGPKTPDGKAASALNNFRHGLAGAFRFLEWESEQEFRELYDGLRDEHAPSTPTEILLIESLAQHFWLMQRAMRLQERALHTGFQDPAEEKRFPIYLRYQTTHERAFNQSLNQLLKLRAEKRKAEIGFESQERKRNEESRKEAEQAQRKRLGEARQERLQADEIRKQAAETRKQELHEARLRALNAQTSQREIDNEIRQTIEAPLPGHARIPFETLKSTFRLAVDEVNRQLQSEQAA